MKRVHVLEFEDLAWFPSWLRTCMTNLLAALGRVLGVPAVLGALVTRVVRQEGIDAIVDLGSGSGGSMPQLLAELREDPATAHLSLTMTDLYPNLDAVEAFNSDDASHIRYHRESVDATKMGTAPAGLKTMVNCFHHMRPEQARAILRSAETSGQPLLVYEMGDHMVPFAVWVVMLPIALPLVFITALALTPFVRPLTARQLIFTYLIPLIPLFYAWDGQASMARIYAPADLDELLEGMGSEHYRWEKGPALKGNGKALGNYLLGLPIRG